MNAERRFQLVAFAVSVVVVLGALSSLIGLELTGETGPAEPTIRLGEPSSSPDGTDVPWTVGNRGATVATRVVFEVSWTGEPVQQELDYLAPSGEREGVVRFPGTPEGTPEGAIVGWQTP